MELRKKKCQDFINVGLCNAKGGFNHVCLKSVGRFIVREGVTLGGKQTELDDRAETEVILAETEVILAETVSSVRFYGLTRTKLFFLH